MNKRTRNKPVANQQHPPQIEHRELRVTQSISVGPLPSADELQKYNDVCPGFAERIVVMAEQQAQHRQFMESYALTSNAKERRIGQFLGLGIGLAAIACGTFLAYMGHDLAGTTIGGAGVAGLVSIFVIGRYMAHPTKE